jgi:hypothetical protein
MAEEKVKKTATKKSAAPKEEVVAAPVATKAVNRLELKYKNEVLPALVKKFNYKSVMQAPKLNKIVINMGVGDATGNAKLLEDAVKELTAIAGQKPVVTKAKKSEASVKAKKLVVKLLYAVPECMTSLIN